jgi:two-component system sensor histidine kinase AtoS
MLLWCEMSYFSQLPFANLGRRQTLPPLEVQAMLEVMPHAALLVNAQTLQVVQANAHAAELTLYTRAELAGHPLALLFPSWSFDQNPEIAPAGTGEPPQYTLKLNQHNGNLQDVHCTVQFLTPKNKWLLVIIELESLYLKRQVEIQSQDRFWESLQKLMNAPQTSSSDEALKEAMLAGKNLTQATIMAIYQAIDKVPGLKLTASSGDVSLLPTDLPPQDLTSLRKPYLWQPERRSLSSLHRVARGNNFTYLASAPLGQTKAAIGLIVLADQRCAPTENVLAITQSLASVLTLIIQQNAQQSNWQEDLEKQNSQLAISQKLESVIQEGLILLSPDLLTIRMNPAAEMILGYASYEVHDQPAENYLIGSETLLPALIDAQQGNATFNLGSVRIYHRHGNAFLARMAVFPIFDQERVDKILILIQDLSEKEQIREQTQQLEQRAILGEVMAIFAHEVRNPINNLSTGLQLMELNLPPEDPNQEVINRLKQDCDRLEEQMKSLLSFSRPTGYEMTQLDINELLKRLLERMHPHIARANVKYHLQTDPNCPPIQGNLRALEQVFNNLINNAVQAMGEKGGRLALRVTAVTSSKGTAQVKQADPSKERRYVEITVADTGPGIPKEMQERIFQPFFTTNRNGTGLGLAITKRIINAHKGTIQVTSVPGGTVFHVELPIAEEISS